MLATSDTLISSITNGSRALNGFKLVTPPNDGHPLEGHYPTLI